MFYVILKGRNASLDYINKKLRKSKNWDFSKGVSPSFWSKIGNFCRFLLFRENRPEKCVLRNSKRKKRLSRLKKQEVEKVAKLGFFQRGLSVVLVKNW